MNGFKTIIGMIVSAAVVPILTKHGFPALSDNEQAELVGALMAGIAIGFRAVTNSPIFHSIKEYLASRKVSAAVSNTVTAVSPEVVQAIAQATVLELKKSFKETKP